MPGPIANNNSQPFEPPPKMSQAKPSGWMKWGWNSSGKIIRTSQKILSTVATKAIPPATCWAAKKFSKVFGPETTSYESIRQVIHENSDDQFEQLFDKATEFIDNLLEKEFQNKDSYVHLLKYISSDPKKDLLEVVHLNMAKGAAHLAIQVKKSNTHEERPFFVNVINHLYGQMNGTIKIKKINDLKDKYKIDLEYLEELKKGLFEENDEKVRLLLNRYADCTPGVAFKEIKEEILKELQELIVPNENQSDEKFVEFSHLLEKKLKYTYKLEIIFGQWADTLIEQFFPHKIADIEIPGIIQSVLPTNLAYNYIRNAFSKMILEHYLSFEELMDIKKQKEELREKTGSDFLPAMVSALSKDVMKSLSASWGVGDKTALISTAVMDKETFLKTIEGYIPPEFKSLFPFISEQIDLALKNDPRSKKTYEFIEQVIEGALLKTVGTIASVNEPRNGKSSEQVIVEKMRALFLKGYRELRSEKEIGGVVKGLISDLTVDILGIARLNTINDSQVLEPSDALSRMPVPLQESIVGYFRSVDFEKLITDKLNNFKLGMEQLSSADEGIKSKKTSLKRFDSSKDSDKSNAEIIAEDLIGLSIPSLIDMLQREGAEQRNGLNMIIKPIESFLSALTPDSESAKLLMSYEKGADFVALLHRDIAALSDEELNEETQRISGALSNFLLGPLDELLGQVAGFDKKNGDSTRNVMGQLFLVTAEHFKTLSEVQKTGDGKITHQNFVSAAEKKKNLHKALPLTPINFDLTIQTIKIILPDLNANSEEALARIETIRKTIKRLAEKEARGINILSNEDIFNEIKTVYEYHSDVKLTIEQEKALKGYAQNGLTLRDIVRKEAAAHEAQKFENAYRPASKVLMSLLFPGGEKTLTFVPEDYRKKAWGLFENNLLPVVLPILMELILNSDTIEKGILSFLESTRDSLNAEAKAKPDGEKPEKREFVETPESKFLGEASGELVVAVLNKMQLPDYLRNKVVDRDTHKLKPEFTAMLVNNLGEVFNEKFIENTLQTALASGASRNKQGEFALKYKKPGTPIDEATLKADRIKRKKAFRKVSRELVRAGISNYIRTSWVTAQKKFDIIVESRLGYLGSTMKYCLDAMFRFVFLTVIGTVLSVILKPIEYLTLEAVFKYVSVDDNLQSVLGVFTEAPDDQPEGYAYNVYNENLIYNLVEALADAVNKESAVPGPEKALADDAAGVILNKLAA